MFGWLKKRFKSEPVPPPLVVPDCEHVKHLMRNAIAGMQLARKRALDVMKSADIRFVANMQVLEETLSRMKDPKND